MTVLILAWQTPPTQLLKIHNVHSSLIYASFKEKLKSQTPWLLTYHVIAIAVIFIAFYSLHISYIAILLKHFLKTPSQQ